MTTAPLDQPIRDALSRGGVIDITTTGRKTGNPHRIEIVFHNVGGRLYVSGMPGFKRSYIANLTANPHFTFHLKRGVHADLAAKCSGDHRRNRAPRRAAPHRANLEA